MALKEKEPTSKGARAGGRGTAWQELLPRLSSYAQEEAEVAGPAHPVNHTNVLIKPQFWT